MVQPRTGVVFFGLALVVSTWAAAPLAAQDEVTPIEAPPECEVDLQSVGQMQDVLSNVLTRALFLEHDVVRGPLAELRKKSTSGPDLVRRTAEHFDLDQDELAELVHDFHHVNCEHDHAARQFARNVTTHVVLHELGHALVREFDLPVLANEEALADAFATHYLTTHLPERAPDVLLARVQSLMLEAREVPRSEWPVRGEHPSDARRAHQIAALAMAIDREKYAAVADAAGMSSKDRRRSADYGAEIHRSWRRMLAPLWMPEGQPSNEVRVKFDVGSEIGRELGTSDPVDELRAALRRFDWHSQITLQLVDGEGGAAWSRNGRTINVHWSYVHRFVVQGMRLSLLDEKPGD